MPRFVHCSDLHLGLRFSQHPDKDKAAELYRSRLSVLDSLAELAREREADFVVIAGDLFDSHTVDDDLVHQVCDRLRHFTVPVYILPGNHDHFEGGEQGVYQRKAWAPPEKVEVLSAPEPKAILDGRVWLFPARACVRREVSPCAWYLEAPRPSETGDAIRVGIAHGTTMEFKDQGDSDTLLDPTRHVADGELDYLALGDWHGSASLSQGERAWYSGAAEATGFRQANSGGALVVTISARGALPQVEPVRVARVTWLSALPGAPTHLVDADGLDQFERAVDALESPQDTCLRLTLSGVLGGDDYTRLQALLARLNGVLLWPRIDAEGVVDGGFGDRLAALAARDTLLAGVINELQAKADEGGADAETAREALKIMVEVTTKGGSK